jgi:hypothetical protein
MNKMIIVFSDGSTFVMHDKDVVVQFSALLAGFLESNGESYQQITVPIPAAYTYHTFVNFYNYLYYPDLPITNPILFKIILVAHYIDFHYQDYIYLKDWIRLLYDRDPVRYYRLPPDIINLEKDPYLEHFLQFFSDTVTMSIVSFLEIVGFYDDHVFDGLLLDKYERHEISTHVKCSANRPRDASFVKFMTRCLPHIHDQYPFRKWVAYIIQPLSSAKIAIINNRLHDRQIQLAIAAN